jgi:glycosyltransferase involved in cell wall biosynthesis
VNEERRRTRDLVSVVVTSYNVAPYLSSAVESALRQSYRQLEVLVVDDGSSDGSLESLSGIHDPRLELFALPHQGPAATLNAGLERASGEFIAFLDGDDLYAERNLECQLAVLHNHPDVDLTFCRSRMIAEDGSDLGPTTRYLARPISFDDLLTDNVIGNGSAVVVRSAAIETAGPYDTQLGACYDLDLWLRIARLRSGNVRALPDVLLYYRRRPGQLTGSRQLMERNWWQLIEKMRALEPEAIARLGRRAASNMYRFLAYICYERGATGEALALVGRSVRYAPRHSLAVRRTYLLLAGIVAGMLLPDAVHARLERRLRRGLGWRRPQSA